MIMKISPLMMKILNTQKAPKAQVTKRSVDMAWKQDLTDLSLKLDDVVDALNAMMDSYGGGKYTATRGVMKLACASITQARVYVDTLFQAPAIRARPRKRHGRK